MTERGLSSCRGSYIAINSKPTLQKRPVLSIILTKQVDDLGILATTANVKSVQLHSLPHRSWHRTSSATGRSRQDLQRLPSSSCVPVRAKHAFCLPASSCNRTISASPLWYASVSRSCVPLARSNIRLGTSLQQQADDLDMTSIGCTAQRCLPV